MASKLENSGDFSNFDCPKCFHKNTVTTKDEVKRFYFCCYCGEKVEVKNEKISKAEFIFFKFDEDTLRNVNKNEALIIEQYKADAPFAEFVNLLEQDDKVKITIEVVK